MLGRFSLLILGALLLAAAPFAFSGSDHRCSDGRSQGLWNLPVGDHLGEAHGALVMAGHDQPVLVLDAALARLHPHMGVMEGGLYLPGHPDGAPLFRVLGRWVVGAHSAGRFEALILRVHGDHAPQRVGRIVG